jgi:hypothetical protein
MWSRRGLGALLLAGGLTAACSRLFPARPPPPPPPYPLVPSPKAAAEKALADLKFMTTAQTFAELGFASLAEVATSQLGEPFTIFEIARDAIRHYVHGTPADGLLKLSRQTLYPVTASGLVRSSVSIVKEPGGYRPSLLGGAAVIKALSFYRRHPSGVSDTVVRIPSLNLLFLSRRKNGDLMFVPVFNEPELGLIANEETSAEVVATNMIPLANAASDLPG